MSEVAMPTEQEVLEAVVRLRELQRSDQGLRIVLAGMLQQTGCSDLIELAKEMPVEVVLLADEMESVNEQVSTFDEMLQNGDLR